MVKKGLIRDIDLHFTHINSTFSVLCHLSYFIVLRKILNINIRTPTLVFSYSK